MTCKNELHYSYFEVETNVDSFSELSRSGVCYDLEHLCWPITSLMGNTGIMS